MLVLVTNRLDLTADWVVDELQARDAQFIRFNTEDFPLHAQLELGADRARLDLGSRTVDAASVRSVWWRRPVDGPYSSGASAREGAWAAQEARMALAGFWSATHAHWVNDPEANVRAECKPRQLRTAIEVGLDVPETLVTNTPDRARSFITEHGDVVCKAVFDGRVPHGDEDDVLLYTSRITPADVDASFGPEPYLLQKRVEKAYDIRVTVIGDEAHACRIDSQDEAEAALDWRLGSDQLHHAVESLPRVVADQCVALTKRFGLRFSAIDLARRRDGGYSFFEINPNGQWAWIQQLTGLPLAARLVDELLSH